MPAIPAAPPNPMAANNKMAAGGNFFSSGTPGGGAQTGGYNYALQNLQAALKASGNTTQAQQMQLGQQLQQNQANVQQNLASRGLGNTTISQTMAQAPLQTYNLGMAQVGDLNALRQMSAYQNLAQMAGQGGNAISQLNQPYAQTSFMQRMMQGMQRPQSSYSPAIPSDFSQQQPQAQQQMQPQPQLYYGPGQAGTGQAMSPDQAALAQQYQFLMGAGGAGGMTADTGE